MTRDCVDIDLVIDVLEADSVEKESPLIAERESKSAIGKIRKHGRRRR